MPGGRPSKMTDVVGYARHPDGSEDRSRPITVTERVLELVRAGNYVEQAAAAAGVAKALFYQWEREGARCRADIEKAVAARKARPKLTAHQQRCVEFLDAVHRAEAEAEARDVALLAQLAQGGLLVERTVEKYDGAGRLVDKQVKVEHTLPDVRSLTWRLEHRHQARWGRHLVEVSGPDGEAIPVEVRADRIAEQLAAIRGEREPDPSTNGRGMTGTADPEA